MKETKELPDLRIVRVSASDQVCDKMKELILDGTWPVNEKLPTEYELAEMFGVNRMTVRTALQKLNTLGVLETRPGEGTFVRTFDFSWLIEEIADFYMTPRLMKDISSFRQILETGCIPLVIENGTPEELAELKDITERACASIRSRYENRGRLTARENNAHYQKLFDFHEQIFKMAHNELLYYSYAVARKSICRMIVTMGEKRFAAQRESNLDLGVSYHRIICRAIEEKDVEACRAAMSKLLSDESIFEET